MVRKTPSGHLAASFSPVANYKFEDAEPKLADFKAVVAGIGLATRDSLLMKDIGEYVADEYKITPDVKMAFDVLAGQHKDGFSLTIVAATHDGKKVFMPVLAEQESGRTLVMGPASLGGGAPGTGTQYVSAAASDAVEQVNNFMAELMRLRAEKGKLDTLTSGELVETIVLSSSVITDMNSVSLKATDATGIIVPAGYTVGDAFKNIVTGKVETIAYTAAARPTNQKLKL